MPGETSMKLVGCSLWKGGMDFRKDVQKDFIIIFSGLVRESDLILFSAICLFEGCHRAVATVD